MQGAYHGISSCLNKLPRDIVYPWRFSLLKRFHSCFDLFRQDWVVSVLRIGGTISTSESPSTVCLYSSSQYSVHLFRMSKVSVGQFPFLSCMVLVCPCFVLVRVFTSWYAFLLLFFLTVSSISWHCTSIQDSFAFFILFLISWFTTRYFSAPSTVSCLP